MLGLLKSYPEILLALSCFLLLRRCLGTPRGVPITWPVLGMLPGLLGNLHRIHDWSVHLLRASGLTLLFNGSQFLSKMDFIMTCDPANANHILKSAFANYPKGPDFPEIFDALGNGIFVADEESWAAQRKSLHALFADPKFRGFVAETSMGSAERALVPMLARAADLGEVVDLEDVILKSMLDASCKIMFGVEEATFGRVIDEAEEVALLRHLTPMWCWKLMRWLNVGPEKTLARNRETMDAYVMQRIRERREAPPSSSASLDMLSVYLQKGHDDKFLRDMVLNLLIAAGDSTGAGLTWFFWLVAKNPHVETKIFKELKERFGEADEQTKVFDAESLCGLVYLHAALCEALRLYPPVPVNHKWAAKADVLPSGVSVKAGTRILISMYAMGRMESVWGKDCVEFRPERWITNHGMIKYEPPHKFLAFSAGPRTCLGKDMAFRQMKIVAAAMIYNFKVEAVEGHVVEPRISVVLHMKNGFLAKVRKRGDC